MDKKLEKVLETTIEQEIGGGYDFDEAVSQIKELFLEIIGEDEEPEEYIAKHLTETEISMATKAVKFHARNELRAELRQAI